MTDRIGRGGVPHLAIMARAAMVALGLVALAACSGSYEKILSQPYDTDFDVVSVVGWSGNLDVFMMKSFESEGRVALCGGYTMGTSSFATIGNRRWADVSQIYIANTKIGSGEFLAPMPVYGFRQGEDPKALFLALQEKSPELPCVRSSVPWKAEYDSARIERRGPKKIEVSD